MSSRFNIKNGILILSFIIVLILISNPLISSAVNNVAMIAFLHFFMQEKSTRDPSSLRTTANYFDYSGNDLSSRYKEYHERSIALIESFDDQIAAEIKDGYGLLEEASEAEQLQDFDRAISLYNQAASAENDHVQALALINLIVLEDRLGLRSFENARILGRLSSIPGGQVLDSDSCSDLTLSNISISQIPDSISDRFEVIMVWNGTERSKSFSPPTSNLEIGDNRWRFVRLENQLFIIGRTDNLIRDGSFDNIPIPYSGIPPGFRPLFGSQSIKDTSLVYDSKSHPKESNMVLEFGEMDQLPIGLRSERKEVLEAEINSAFWFSGRYRTSPTAEPRIGYRWILESAQSWDDNISKHIVTNPSTDWKLFQEIRMSSPGTELVEIWMMNLEPMERMWVDDLILLTLPLPCRTNGQ